MTQNQKGRRQSRRLRPGSPLPRKPGPCGEQLPPRLSESPVPQPQTQPSRGLWSSLLADLVLILPLMTLAKRLNLPEPPFPHLANGDAINNSAHLAGCV